MHSPLAGAWSFVAAVWTPTNTTLYVNGASASIVSTHAVANFGQGRICLGADINDGHAINGLMQEAAMFTNALTPAQVQNLYAAAGNAPYIVSVTQTPPGPVNLVGQNITMNVSAYGNGTLTYQWQSNTVTLTGQTGTNLVLNNAQTNYSASYAVVVSNSVGAVTSAPVVLDVASLPVIVTETQTPPGPINFAGQTITLSVSASGTHPWAISGSPTPRR